MPSLLRPIGFAVVAAGLTLPAACLDFTPVSSSSIETTTPLSDASPSGDASADGAAPLNKCLACAAGGAGCAKEYKACVASAACESAVVCATDMCLMSIATVTQCLGACESDAGVSDPQSPANGVFSALFSCMSMHCQTECLP